MKISVLVPTYRRPADLARCLQALQRQARAPDEVIVVARPEDDATHERLADPSVGGALPLQVVPVDVPGQVAALNKGLDSAHGDIVAITDDDAAPRPDWLARVEAAFEADPRVGAVGGRDWVHEKGRVLDESRERVGQLTLSGKIVGNHHLGVGGAREVDMLKGANMSYRRAAIERLRFDTRLRGAGAQVHNDMAFSMRVQRDGWKLVYDPAIAVDHFPAERFDDDRRDAASLNAISNGAYNLHLILREHLPLVRREIAWWWWTLVGTRVYPGLAHLLLALPAARRERVREHWRAVRRGARDARRANLASHRAAMPPVTS
ncbi:glycosyltransferase family 2 protein [Burkholderia stagnalis]|uniref:Glycosyl transferase n=1 Tax=Burkholderia stagnalis TaxID=1503054 RepID=A0A119RL59_9BURK|nr:glycosyltransferase family 2 protein [Burkholderia stagnalis]KVZ02419.1 glycosyl transferase [Burkholderia stagnalis]KWA53529.1 glycosyl transferase [Burkholderia stagnalis]KWA58645.1 glycosyl transferase [Burkholderia stagnalis]KWA60532.1 glycosyl transferase [Burkholderia stagnalis]KWC97405.1 glycosyl transferase [Burkholderia stagnalis]